MRSLTWSVVERHADRLALEVLLLDHPGWPFPVLASMRYALDADGLSCALTAANVGREPCPYGAAFHRTWRCPVDGWTTLSSTSTRRRGWRPTTG